MTNYIEEMMKTAGVKPNYIVKENNGKMKAKATFHKRIEAEIYQAKFGGELIESFDFTAEKQLEIIKLLNGVQIFDDEIRYDLFVTYDQDIEAEYAFSYGGFSDVSFDQALAQLTTELMKAGELDKEKVKEILQ